MNVLLWYQAFLEEGFISNAPKRTNRGLTVVPLCRKFNLRSLVSGCSEVICDLLYDSTMRFSTKDMTEVRDWLTALPSSVREDLLTAMYSHQRRDCRLTRSEYFHVISGCWQLLYSKDWAEVTVPDLQVLLQTRSDIRTDSPSALEDLERVLRSAKFKVENTAFLRRLGIVPSSVVPGESASKTRDPTSHMTQSDIYSSILDLLLSFDQSKTLVFKLNAFSSKNVYSFREKQLVSRLIPQLRRVQVLDLGHAVDDSILQEVGRSCPTVRKLNIAGSAITDSGLEVLAEEGRHSGLTTSLTSLSLHSTALVSLPGILHLLAQLLQLTELSLQESLLLQILRREEGEEMDVPVRQLELTLGPGRRDYLTSAASIFPHLLHLTLWCFESENISSLSGFTAWPQFSQLSSLTLNNIANCDFLEIIKAVGSQLRIIDIDNFSNDDSDLQIYLDVYQIGIFCPKIQTLSLAMAFVDFKPNNNDSDNIPQSIFPSLSELCLKSNKYGSPATLSNFLLRTPNLVKLSIQSKTERRSEAESEVLSDDMMVQLLVRNGLQNLEEITLNTMEYPHSIGSKLNLTTITLTHLLTHCQHLESIGDLTKWNLPDIDETIDILSTQWAWTRYI